MNVSIGLGLYLSERNNGPFKNVVVTFSDKPAFVKLRQSSLYDRVQELARVPWGMSTNLEACFKQMLKLCVEGNVSAGDMPSTLLIISDMQFDQCAKGVGKSAMEMIRKQYDKAGYVMPSIVFWNVRASKGQPAKHDESGTALVSGYSPSIMQSILARKPQSTPYELMLDTLNSDRYKEVVI